MKKKYEIVFEDEALVVVNKAPGLLSIRDRYSPEKENLSDLLGARFGAVWTVHRLDKETSGIICFAKTAEAHKTLSQQFEDRTVTKTYLALVDGRLEKQEGFIDLPIAHAPSGNGKMKIASKGKKSLTEYKVIDYFRHFTLTEVRILTGRTHQIRVHFQALGHPLCVDKLYGKRHELFLSEIKGRSFRAGKDKVERPLLQRSALHASSLELMHPVSGEKKTFTAPLPKDLKAILNQLGKWAK